jgi:hypothetical protein
MSVPVIDLPVVQGATFRRTVHWYGGGLFCAPIEDVTEGCPTVIKVAGHGLPTISTTPVLLKDIKGATSLNTKRKTVAATYLSADTFSVVVSTVGETYVSGSGVFTYYTPTDLTGFTARMQIKSSRGAATVIHELTTEDGGIALSFTDGGIALYISDADTAGFTFDNAVYDLELISATLDVTRVSQGNVTLNTNVTT